MKTKPCSVAGLIQTCPADYTNSSIRQQCEIGAQAIVNTVSYTPRKIWSKNIYCALCIGIDISQLKCRRPTGMY